MFISNFLEIMWMCLFIKDGGEIIMNIKDYNSDFLWKSKNIINKK